MAELAVATQEKRELKNIDFSRGVLPKDYDDVMRFAGLVHASSLAPKSFDSAAKVAIGILMNMELGRPVITGLQDLAVINGKVGMWGAGRLGYILASGHMEDGYPQYEERGTPFQDDWTFVFKIKRKGHPERIGTFTWAEAKRAGFDNPKQRDGRPDTFSPWARFTRRMMEWKSRNWVLEDEFGDVLRGMRAAEDLQDIIIDMEAGPGGKFTQPGNGGTVTDLNAAVKAALTNETEAAKPSLVPGTIEKTFVTQGPIPKPSQKAEVSTPPPNGTQEPPPAELVAAAPETSPEEVWFEENWRQRWKEGVAEKLIRENAVLIGGFSPEGYARCKALWAEKVKGQPWPIQEAKGNTAPPPPDPDVPTNEEYMKWVQSVQDYRVKLGEDEYAKAKAALGYGNLKEVPQSKKIQAEILSALANALPAAPPDLDTPTPHERVEWVQAIVNERARIGDEAYRSEMAGLKYSSLNDVPQSRTVQESVLNILKAVSPLRFSKTSTPAEPPWEEPPGDPGPDRVPGEDDDPPTSNKVGTPLVLNPDGKTYQFYDWSVSLTTDGCLVPWDTKRITERISVALHMAGVGLVDELKKINPAYHGMDDVHPKDRIDVLEKLIVRVQELKAG